MIQVALLSVIGSTRQAAQIFAADQFIERIGILAFVAIIFVQRLTHQGEVLLQYRLRIFPDWKNSAARQW